MFLINDEKYITEYEKWISLMHKYNTTIGSQIATSGFNKKGKLIGLN